MSGTSTERPFSETDILPPPDKNGQSREQKSFGNPAVTVFLDPWLCGPALRQVCLFDFANAIITLNLEIVNNLCYSKFMQTKFYGEKPKRPWKKLILGFLSGIFLGLVL